MTKPEGPFIVGWEEWVALPDLGLPAIKAKIDTGARTSALHAFTIEAFGLPEQPMVRFAIHPVPGREDIEVVCTAPVIDRREVTSSNGEREMRYVIEARIVMGERAWPIEITLTNRETMAYRMLLGRQAIRDDMFVDASTSFRQPRLSHKLYRRPARRERPDGARPGLRIAILTRKPLSPSNRRLIGAAEAEGHMAEALDPGRLSLVLDAAAPRIELDGAPLAAFDAVIPRTGPGPFSAAAVRQLELAGTASITPAAALDRLRNPLATLQALARSGLPLPLARLDAKSWSHAWRDAGELMPRLSVLVVGRRARAAVLHRGDEPAPVALDAHATERDVAETAAGALDLGLAAIDLAPVSAGAPTVIAVSAAPLLGAFERATRERLAPVIISAAVALAKARPGL
jgi:ribosomal protein S6--L-glutamate ligase